ncbi:MAG: hydrogenase maturation factor [Lachnospiraceae bacterium]|nr:hydrogenase maturation factor [Lachnospiraceae bacterium]
MKTGRLAENVWKRSVLKQIKTKREEVVIGAGIGEDCAILSLAKEGLTSVTMDFAAWQGEKLARYAIHGAVNGLAASGAEPVAVLLSVLLPSDREEAWLRALMEEAEGECADLQIQLAAGQVTVTEAVNRPLVTVTGIGKSSREDIPSIHRIVPGLDLVVSKWIGLEGTSILAGNYREDLLTRYPSRLIEEAKEFDRFLSVVPEAAIAGKSNVCAMHNAAEGGIFASLWELAEGAGVGLEIDLKRIPIKQETIEVCEFFGINPYELKSGGCLLVAVDNGWRLVRELEKQQIPAALIGRTTQGRDRVVFQGEERRFLERPKPDELYKVMK